MLDAPYTAAAPAALPPRNYLAGLASGNGGLSKQTFTVVGYGVFFEKPTEGPQKPTAVADRTRRFTDAVGQNISSQVLKLAENAEGLARRRRLLLRGLRRSGVPSGSPRR